MPPDVDSQPNTPATSDATDLSVPQPSAAPAGSNTLEAFEANRGLLFAIAYRMLGTVADAEDTVQEAFLRWQSVPQETIESPRAFLVTVVSRLCINHLRSARVQREEYFGEWLPEPLMTGPGGDPAKGVATDDSLSFAFLVLLERLSPVERAVFVLRELFDFEYGDIARIVDKSEANCRQIFRRARISIAQDRPRFQPSWQERDRLLREFLKATTTGDLQGLVALLAEDVTFRSDGGGKVVAVPKPVYGRENVVRLLFGALRKLLPAGIVRSIVETNGGPAIASYFERRPHSLLYLDVWNGTIRNIYVVSNPDKLQRMPASGG